MPPCPPFLVDVPGVGHGIPHVKGYNSTPHMQTALFFQKTNASKYTFHE
jgi:hypothetical protein